jgi:hypothetical protein
LSGNSPKQALVIIDSLMSIISAGGLRPASFFRVRINLKFIQL